MDGMNLPLSLIGRINTIKMNLLPKFIYLFQCIPLKVPISFFKELDKSLTYFQWHNKTLRVKLLTLQAPYSKGGLNLPNFKLYYLAAQLRALWMWFHCRADEVKWMSIEQHELQDNPLTIVPFLESKKKLKTITQNPIISATFNAWQQLHVTLDKT